MQQQLKCPQCNSPVVCGAQFCNHCGTPLTWQQQPQQAAQSSSTQLDLRKAECPSCHGQLKKIPGSKTKCPHCGNYIHVLTRPSDNARVVVDEVNAEKIREEWAIKTGRHDIYLVEKRSKEAEKQEKEIIHQTLLKKFGKEPSKDDIEWSFSNNRLVDAMKQNDWNEIGLIYRKQAILLDKEGRDSTRVRQESNKAFKKVMRNVLLDYQKSAVVDKVEILAAGENSCPACMALNGKIYTIRQALKENPLPVENCNGGYGYCRCCYLPVV